MKYQRAVSLFFCLFKQKEQKLHYEWIWYMMGAGKLISGYRVFSLPDTE